MSDETTNDMSREQINDRMWKFIEENVFKTTSRDSRINPSSDVAPDPELLKQTLDYLERTGGDASLIKAIKSRQTQ